MNSTPASPCITKVFSLMVWTEMDRVRMGKHFYTVTITGERGAAPEALRYEIDGKPASMDDVGELLYWARYGGSVELVAEEVAA